MSDTGPIQLTASGGGYVVSARDLDEIQEWLGELCYDLIDATNESIVRHRKIAALLLNQISHARAAAEQAVDPLLSRGIVQVTDTPDVD